MHSFEGRFMKKFIIALILCFALSGYSQNRVINQEETADIQIRVNIEKTHAELLDEHLVEYNQWLYQ